MSDQTFLILFALALYIFAAMFFAAGFFLRSKTRRILDSALVTKGTIVALQPSVTMSSEMVYRVFCPYFTFKDAQGTEHCVRSSSSIYPGDHKVGDVVEVFYNSRSPQDAIIDPKAAFRMARICIGAGSAAAIVATAMIILPRFS